MLRLFVVEVQNLENNSVLDRHHVLAYNDCHAVNLVYRYYESMDMLNDVRHTKVIELPVIHPSQFKK